MSRAVAGLVAGVLALSPLGARGVVERQDLAAYVDPFIGTMGAGFVFPGPAAPYGMIQISPDTEGVFAYTGYQYGDQFIRGFSLVHVQSMGVPEGGLLPFMPTTGEVVTDVKSYQSKFEHATESAAPGSYRVLLDGYGIEAELAAGLRAGTQRFTYPPGARQNVLIDAGRQIAGGPTDDVQTTPGTTFASIDVVDDRTVTGSSEPVNPEARDRYAVHFAARFDRPFASFGTWDKRGDAPSAGSARIERKEGGGAYVSFDDSASTVTMNVAISFVSPANALSNLDAELSDFDVDGLAGRTRAAWNEALSAIRVEGGTEADKISFYTALYHAQHHPNVFNDANGDYLGYDGQVHRIGADGVMPVGSSYYANFSLWDTYRAQMPLLQTIAPARMEDMMRSMVAIAEQGGRLPRWGLMNRYADYMIGEPALQTVADAFCRGVVPADVRDRLYEAARDLALSSTGRDGPVFRGGWTRNPSTTLEFASGHFALATVADTLGRGADRDALLGYAGHWRNVMDPATRFARPRAADGTWKSPFFPEDSADFTEGTSWQWTWLVPHDVAALASFMDADPATSADTIRARLDTFFATPATATVPFVPAEMQQKLTAYGIAYYGNQYAPSNEHDLQAPYLYDWLGEAWKTQALSRQYQGLYRSTPDGLPGNDDLGTMSAWYVWSALGFYPVIPGAPLNVIGSPVFESASIRLRDGGTFTVEAPGASLAGKYVQTASLNGARLDRTWFPAASMTDGNVLRVEMGAAPNVGWGSAPDAAPPSQSTSAISSFGCVL